MSFCALKHYNLLCITKLNCNYTISQYTTLKNNSSLSTFRVNTGGVFYYIMMRLTTIILTIICIPVYSKGVLGPQTGLEDTPGGRPDLVLHESTTLSPLETFRSQALELQKVEQRIKTLMTERRDLLEAQASYVLI